MSVYNITPNEGMVDTDVLHAVQERSRVERLLESRKTVFGPGKVYDGITAFFLIGAPATWTWLYAQIDRKGDSPINYGDATLRGFATVLAAVATILVVGRVSIYVHGRRAAEADRIQAFYHQQQLEEIRGSCGYGAAYLQGRKDEREQSRGLRSVPTGALKGD